MKKGERKAFEELMAKINDSRWSLWREEQGDSRGESVSYFMSKKLAQSIISLTLKLDNETDKTSVIEALKEKLLVVERQYYENKWKKLDNNARDGFVSSEGYVQSFLEFANNNESLVKRLQYVFLGGLHAKPSTFVQANYLTFLKHLELSGRRRPRPSQIGAPRGLSRSGRRPASGKRGRCVGGVVSPSTYSGGLFEREVIAKRTKVGYAGKRGHQIFSLLDSSGSLDNAGCEINSLTLQN